MDALLLTSNGDAVDGRVAIGQSLEMVVPIVGDGPRVAFQIFVHRVHDGTRVEVDRQPRTRPIVVARPSLDPAFHYWNA